MDLHPLVRIEWREDHRLSRRSLIWIDEHADPGDPHPVTSAIAQLHAAARRPACAVIRLGILALVGVALAGGAPPASAAKRTADLHIVNQGAPASYRTLGLTPAAFDLTDGATRHFRNLPPGRYVVVQAPPVPGAVMQIVCSNGQANQVDLGAGDNVTCTITLT